MQYACSDLASPRRAARRVPADTWVYPDKKRDVPAGTPYQQAQTPPSGPCGYRHRPGIPQICLRLSTRCTSDTPDPPHVTEEITPSGAGATSYLFSIEPIFAKIDGFERTFAEYKRVKKWVLDSLTR